MMCFSGWIETIGPIPTVFKTCSNSIPFKLSSDHDVIKPLSKNALFYLFDY